MRRRSADFWRNLRPLFLCGIATVLVGALQAFQSPPAAPSGGRQPFNKAELIQLLKLEAPDSLLLPQIRSAGIDFIATQEDFDGFTKMGASATFVSVIREASSRLAARKAAEAEATTREAEALLWSEVQKEPDRQALEAYLRRFPDGPNAGLAKERLQSIGATTEHAESLPSTPSIPMAKTLEERLRISGDKYRAKGYNIGNIVAIRESPEDAVIGRLDHGEYFKATVQGWTRIDPQHLDSVPQALRDLLNTNIDHPMVWLIDRNALKDIDYDKHYNLMLDNAALALFGRVAGSVILTASDPTIPSDKVADANSNTIPSRLAFYNLMGAAPNLDVVEPPLKSPAERGDFSYETIAKTKAGAYQTLPRVSSYYFSSGKTRVDTGNTSTIIDFAAQTTMLINNTSKTYVVKNGVGLTATTDARDLDSALSYWFGSKPKTTMKETGQKMTVNGFNANEVLMTIEGLHHQKRKIEMEIDMWVSPDIPNGSKLREFYKRNAGNVPQIVMGFPWDAMFWGGNPSAGAALADAQRKMASMNGIVIEQIVRVKVGGRWSSFAPVDSGGFSTKNIPDSVFAIPVGYHRRVAIGAVR
jgi:hypothetical protein